VTSRVTAVLGKNGAGKTKFLKNVAGLLCGLPAERGQVQVIGIDGNFNGRPFSVVRGAAPPEGLAAEYIDVSHDVHLIQRYYSDQANFDELLAQYEAATLNTSELGLFQYVCGQDYSIVRVTEVETPELMDGANDGGNDEPETVYPFFSVETPRLSYDSRSMGFGELCSCYLIWKALRAEKGSVLILDEPDSHLSPSVRRALIDMLAYVADKRDLWVLFSTHAAEPLETLRESEFSVIYYDQVANETRLDPAATRRDVLRALGLTPPRRLLLVVEDVDAAETLVQIVNRWGGDYSTVVDVQVVPGGAAEVVRFVSLFPSASRVCKVIAVLDGDKRTAYAQRAGVLFLPSDDDPIAAARELVRTDSQSFSLLTGVGEQRLNSAVAAIRSVNHHDFCLQLVRELGLTDFPTANMRNALLRAWLSSGPVAQVAEQLSAEIRQQVNAIPFENSC
jgi:energy-coupling factor transporter ATP-binding protein EcfA2